MLDHLAARVNGDANLVRRGKHVTTTFLIAIDNADHLVSVSEGKITAIRPGPFSPSVRRGKNCAVGAALSKRIVTVVFGDVRPSAVAYHQV